MSFSEVFDQYQQNHQALSKEDYVSQLKESQGVDISPRLVKNLRSEAEPYIVIGNTGLYINISTKPLEYDGEVLISNIHFKPEGNESPVKGQELRFTFLGVMGILGLLKLFDSLDPKKEKTFISVGLPNNEQLKTLFVKLPQKYGGVNLSSLRDENHPMRQQLERIALKAKNLKDIQLPW